MMTGAINLLADVGGSYWLPPRASGYAGASDWVFWFIMGICIFFFGLVAALVVTFAIKYRHREGVVTDTAASHSTALEITWTLIPTVIVFIIFYYGFKGYMAGTVAPSNAMPIVVNAVQWSYSFDYPNGVNDSEIHIPINVPVEFILSSSDVIHGFYIPAFRIKKDIVPGRYNKIWVQADQLGEYDIFCTQYCGLDHSGMRAKLYVQTPQQYAAWLDKKALEAASIPPVDHGKAIYTKFCNSCHTIDGSASTGPTWKNLFGYPVKFADSSSLTVDEDYLRSMILNPNNKIVAGFLPVMPSFQGQLKDRTHDVDHLIAFIKSLSDKGQPPALPGAAQPTTKP